MKFSQYATDVFLDLRYILWEATTPLFRLTQLCVTVGTLLHLVEKGIVAAILGLFFICTYFSIVFVICKLTTGKWFREVSKDLDDDDDDQDGHRQLVGLAA